MPRSSFEIITGISAQLRPQSEFDEGLCRRSPEHPGLSGEGSAMDQGMHLHSSVLYKH